jgi:hypothetical protein
MDKKEWTVMFYFASDNPLAPGVVSQLKAIKQAGFHPDANVIAQFDPQTAGTPTHIFEVNLINKLKSHGAPNIGFAGNDPFVRNLLEDKLWRDQKNRHGHLLREELKEVLDGRIKDINYDPQVPPDDKSVAVPTGRGRSRELPPRQSLENFLRFCVDKYPAQHYMLFILGHGVIVGNDIFLFDEHVSDQSGTLSLTELGEVLTNFTQEVKHQKSEFELVGFHSCSVSSLEVAYELKGTAKYMLASQGPSFVGSWPYRQILIRLFNDLVECGGKIEVEKMLKRIFFYCLYNSSDFLLAGYSYDLCLCNLDEVEKIQGPLKAFSDVLGQEGLKNTLVRNLILLAHWRSQSFWQESYTDLYDFCFCLRRLCEEHICLNETQGELKRLLERIQEACHNVISRLVDEVPEKDEQSDEEKETKRKGEHEPTKKIIIRSAFAGPACQYSHGLSVYFPWSSPAEDTQILEEYERYKFKETSWLSFLEEYFDLTLRRTRREERAEEAVRRDEANENNPCKIFREEIPAEESEDRFQVLLEDIASLVYNEEGQLSSSYALSGPKTDPTDRTGDGYAGPCIKNYPHDTRPRGSRGTQAAGTKQTVPLSGALSTAFKVLDE